MTINDACISALIWEEERREVSSVPCYREMWNEVIDKGGYRYTELNYMPCILHLYISFHLHSNTTLAFIHYEQ